MPSDGSLFRERAFARRGQTEPLDGLLRVTAPHEWAILIGLALALLGVVAWGLFGRIERSLETACVLARPGERSAVISESAGEVVDVLVHTGDRIEAGQPIARIRVPELRRDVALARARVTALEETAAAAGPELALARAELRELEELEAASEFIAGTRAGVVASQALAPGQAVLAGSEVARIVDLAPGGLEAVALVPPERAQRLEAGMGAYVLPSAPGLSGSPALEAVVHHVSPRPVTPPGWLLAFGLPVPPSSHMVRLSLSEPPAETLADGDLCNLRVVLGEGPPARLVLPSGRD